MFMWLTRCKRFTVWPLKPLSVGLCCYKLVSHRLGIKISLGISSNEFILVYRAKFPVTAIITLINRSVDACRSISTWSNDSDVPDDVRSSAIDFPTNGSKKSNSADSELGWRRFLWFSSWLLLRRVFGNLIGMVKSFRSWIMQVLSERLWERQQLQNASQVKNAVEELQESQKIIFKSVQKLHHWGQQTMARGETKVTKETFLFENWIHSLMRTVSTW